MVASWDMKAPTSQELGEASTRSGSGRSKRLTDGGAESCQQRNNVWSMWLLNRLVDLCVNNVRYRDRLRVNMLILAECSQVGSHQSLFDVYHLKAAALIRLEHSTINSFYFK